MSDTLAHVHVTRESVRNEELTPPHGPRTETPIYAAIHKRLLFQEDRPCFVCGVRHSDLQDAQRRADPTINPYGATEMESHHVVVERSLTDAVDPALVAHDYPSVHQFKTFLEWVDGSEDNIKPFCDACHRTAPHAIHHTLWQDVIATKYGRRLPDGTRYVFVATPQSEPAALAADERIEQAAGIEQQVAAAMPDHAAASSASAPAPTRPTTLTARLRAQVQRTRTRTNSRPQKGQVAA